MRWDWLRQGLQVASTVKGPLERDPPRRKRGKRSNAKSPVRREGEWRGSEGEEEEGDPGEGACFVLL